MNVPRASPQSAGRFLPCADCCNVKQTTTDGDSIAQRQSTAAARALKSASGCGGFSPRSPTASRVRLGQHNPRSVDVSVCDARSVTSQTTEGLHLQSPGFRPFGIRTVSTTSICGKSAQFDSFFPAVLQTPDPEHLHGLMPPGLRGLPLAQVEGSLQTGSKLGPYSAQLHGPRGMGFLRQIFPSTPRASQPSSVVLK